jgi:hypothetical protein
MSDPKNDDPKIYACFYGDGPHGIMDHGVLYELLHNSRSSPTVAVDCSEFFRTQYLRPSNRGFDEPGAEYEPDDYLSAKGSLYSGPPIELFASDKKVSKFEVFFVPSDEQSECRMEGFRFKDEVITLKILLSPGGYYELARGLSEKNLGMKVRIILDIGSGLNFFYNAAAQRLKLLISSDWESIQGLPREPREGLRPFWECDATSPFILRLDTRL